MQRPFTMRRIATPARHVLSILALSAVAAAAQAGTTIYVSPAGNDGGAGTPAAPLATIQAAVNAAGAGGTVVLQPGVYTGPGDNQISLAGQLSGGSVTIEGAGGAGATVVDLAGAQFINIPASMPRSLSLAGLTIKNGLSATSGGAVYIGTTSSATFTDCEFRNNRAGGGAGGHVGYNGGAIAADGPATIQRCRFIGNALDTAGGATIGGGAVEVRDGVVSACAFEDNTSVGGAGGALAVAHSGTVSDCRFAGNTSGTGGAVYALNRPFPTSTVSVVRCLFTANRAGAGMAVYAAGFNLALAMADCVLVNNSSPDPGPAGLGGGVLVISGSRASLANCTIAGNGGPTGAQGTVVSGITSVLDGSVTLANCILRTTDSGSGTSLFGVIVTSATYSDIQGGFAGTGNIDADPRFIDPGAGDYHLAPGSPCIDTGASAAVAAGDTDIEGHPRVFGPAADMGAYELYVRNATDQFTITRGAWTFSRATASYVQPITVTNTGADITTPLYMVFSAVTGGTVTNGTGTTVNTNPVGQRYQLVASTGLTHGSSATLTVVIHATVGQLAYTPLVYTGTGRP